jgi:hypothetical protein
MLVPQGEKLVLQEGPQRRQASSTGGEGLSGDQLVMGMGSPQRQASSTGGPQWRHASEETNLVPHGGGEPSETS